MNEPVYLLNMFSDYAPPGEVEKALSQAAIVAADIHAEHRTVHVAAHSQSYVPRRVVETMEREVAALYGLARLEITLTHPESELQKIEPEELMLLFVSRNSMTRGSLAGAEWHWEGDHLTVRLRANGKATIEELIPAVQQTLRERFAAPVTITVEANAALEGQALLDAMQTMRQAEIERYPTAQARQPSVRSSRTAAPSTASPSGATPSP